MERITHYFYDAIAVNGYLWLLEANINALFKMNIRTFEMEFAASFPNESTVSWLYRFTGIYGSKLVCCPRNARMIVVYDTDSGHMETIGVDFDRHKRKGAGMYGDGAVGSKFYLPRQGYSEIYQLDIPSGELSVLNIVSRETALGMNDYFWHGRIRQYKTDVKILLYSLKYNAFYQYNILTSETKKYCALKNKLIDFVTDGYFIWALCDNGKLYKLDGARVIDEYQCDITETDFVELLYYRNRIYMMDVVAGKIISSLMPDAGGGENISNRIPNNNTGIFRYSFDEDDYFWMQWKDGFFYYYDGVNEVSGIFGSDLEKIPAASFISKEICWESKGFSLQKLLKIMKYQPDVLKNVTESKVGMNIYNIASMD